MVVCIPQGRFCWGRQVGVLHFLPPLGHFYLDRPRDLSKAACPADTLPSSQVSPWPTCLPQCRTSPPLSLTSTPAHTLCARPSGESWQSQAKSHVGDATMKGEHKPCPPCTKHLSDAMSQPLLGAAETCSRGPRRGPPHVTLGLEGAPVICKTVRRMQLLLPSSLMVSGRRGTYVLER